jgi:hypothetical protein
MSNEPSRWVILTIFAALAVAMAFAGSRFLGLNLWIGLGLAALGTLANGLLTE